MKGQAGSGNVFGELITNLQRSVYRDGWLRSLFGVFIAILFITIFESWFLGMLAFAFLFYIPVPSNLKNIRNPNFWLFGIIMIILLFSAFGAGLGLDMGGPIYAPWEWNTSAVIFLTIWIISMITGLGGDLRSRQSIGAVMIIISFVFFAMGPGGQAVGEATFGPWWPTVHEYGTMVFGPLGDALSSITNIFRDSFMMLTDPVGYATRLMNGTYASNPLGSTGALGIEITDLTLSPVYPEIPFYLTAMMANKGSFDAENVKVQFSVNFKGIEADDIGIKEEDITQYLDGEDNYETAKFIREYQEQFTFSSEGLGCDIIESKGLRGKYLPLRVNVTYNYQSDSEVNIEFMSQNEWERLAKENRLNQELVFIKSQYSSAPVMFPIGTPGIKNPILVGKGFHIGMRLESAKGEVSNGGYSIKSAEKVILEYPADLVLDDNGCSPKPSSGPLKKDGDGQTMVITWENMGHGAKVFYCVFKGLEKTKLSGPTKTYVIRAHADYVFETWKEKDMKIEFGGKCCSDDDCLAGQECVNGMCVAEGTSVAGDCDFEPSNKIQFEEMPKYHNEIRSALQKHSISNMDSSYAAEALVAAVINKESSWNPNTKTPEPNVNDYSFGLMQIRFDTAKDMGFPFKASDTAENYPCDPSKPDNLCYPALNIQYGTKYLAERRASAATLQCTISNYNAGSGCPMGTNSNNCKYVKSVMEYYYRYYFFYDYCGWWNKQGFGECTLGMGGCTGTSQCDQSVTYGPEDGTKKAPICRTDLKPHVCCPPEDVFDKDRCQSAYSEFKSQ